MIRIFNIIILSLIFSSASAKTLQSKDKINKVSDYFMNQVVNGEYESSYSLMSAYAGVNAAQFEERGKRITQDLKQLEQSQGKPLAFALLKQQSVDEHFYKITYLLKYPSAAIVWELNYYQPTTGWKLVDISYNTNINALFSD